MGVDEAKEPVLDQVNTIRQRIEAFDDHKFREYMEEKSQFHNMIWGDNADKNTQGENTLLYNHILGVSLDLEGTTLQDACIGIEFELVMRQISQQNPDNVDADVNGKKECTRNIRNIRTLCGYWLQPAAQLAWDLQIKTKNLKGHRYTFSNAATYPLFGLNDSFTDKAPLPPKYNPRFTTFSELYVSIGDLIETLRAESTLNPKAKLVKMYMKKPARRKTDNANSRLPDLPLSSVEKRDALVKQLAEKCGRATLDKAVDVSYDSLIKSLPSAKVIDGELRMNRDDATKFINSVMVNATLFVTLQR